MTASYFPSRELLERATPSRASELDGLNHAMVDNFIMVRESTLDRVARATSSDILSPTMYQLTGTGTDKLFIGDVIDVGPGDATDVICCKPGQTVLFNEQNISYRIQERGERRWLIRNPMVAAILDRETFHVEPVQSQILVKFDEDTEKRALAHQSGGPIWLPTDVSTDDVSSARPGSKGMTVSYGEVVAKGEGCFIEGKWVAPRCEVGDLLLFDASWGTLPITIKGKSYTLVPAKNVALIADRRTEPVSLPAYRP